jgi:hypothetical protein
MMKLENVIETQSTLAISKSGMKSFYERETVYLGKRSKFRFES